MNKLSVYNVLKKAGSDLLTAILAALCFSIGTAITICLTVIFYAGISERWAVQVFNNMKLLTQADVFIIIVEIATAVLFFELGVLLFASFFKTVKNDNKNNQEDSPR